MSPAAIGAVAAPADVVALASRVRDAAARRAALAVRGSGGWWTEPAPGAEVVTVAGLDAISDFNPADLVVTTGAGVPLDRLAARLAAKGAWLPFDPPGPLSRTVGGALAAGGGGPLAAHYGPARDHVLGLVVVAGDGTVVRLGGRVVKNVAGFDLAKLVIGGHGAFGVIAEAHLRLRARPAADRTHVWRGGPAWVQAATAAAQAGGTSPAALEVVSPGLAARIGWTDADGTWALAARAVGSPAGVEEDLRAIAHAAESPPAVTLEGEEPWTRWRLAVGDWPTVLRIGAEPAAWARAVALAEACCGALLGASVTVPRGTVRIGPAEDAAAIRRLRLEAAALGWPVTVERAAPATRATAGIWGALPPAVERLTRAARACFDPPGILAAPLLA